MTTGGFYRDLEDRFRGDLDSVRGRLSVYLPLVKPLARMNPSACVLDLGCGRGEWLALLRDEGIPARGVDLDAGMLDATRSAGLDAEHQDALEALRNVKPGSLLAVTAFHLVEHMNFSVLLEMVTLAKGALVRDGLLVMETPNPENLFVGSSNFYLDPTHQRPIPPGLLGFVAERAGFQTVRTWRLNAAIRSGQKPDLVDVLTAGSMDYAIIARVTSCDGDVLQHLPDMPGTDTLARNWQARHDDLSGLVGHLNKELSLAQERIVALQQQLSVHEEMFNRLRRSWPWQLVRFGRWVFLQFRKLMEEGLRARTRKGATRLLRSIAASVQHRPAVRAGVLRAASLFGLDSRLRKLHHRVNGLHQVHDHQLRPESLSPRARELHQQLMSAMEAVRAHRP